VGLAVLTLLLALAVGHSTGCRAGRVSARRIAAAGRPGTGRIAAAGRPGTGRIAAAHLLVVAFGVQAVEPLVSQAVPHSYPLALAVSGTVMTQFVIRNAAVPGVPLAGLGLVLNTLVVILNGAMPVSLEAATRAGLPVERLDLDSDPRHERLDVATRFAPLADVVPTPIPGRREVTSPGDILLAAGVGLFVFSAARSRRRQAELPARCAPARDNVLDGSRMC